MSGQNQKCLSISFRIDEGVIEHNNTRQFYHRSIYQRFSIISPFRNLRFCSFLSEWGNLGFWDFSLTKCKIDKLHLSILLLNIVRLTYALKFCKYKCSII